MRNSTRFLLVLPLISAFSAASLSALAEDAKKPVPKAPSAQQGSGTKMGSTGGKGQTPTGSQGHNEKAGSTGKSQSASHGEGQAPQQSGGQNGSSSGDLVGGIVGGAVGGAVGGLLNGTFGR